MGDFLGSMFGFVVAFVAFGFMLAVAVVGFMMSERAVNKSAPHRYASDRPAP